jgi:hypothetical protein
MNQPHNYIAKTWIKRELDRKKRWNFIKT